jgi:hypothetical protein
MKSTDTARANISVCFNATPNNIACRIEISGQRYISIVIDIVNKQTLAEVKNVS